jgi:hypothetical protein
MLVSFFYVLFVTLKSLFMATFRFRSNKALYLSGLNLFKRSFRLSQSDYKNPFIFLTGNLRFIKQLFATGSKHVELTKNDVFIYDLNPDSTDIRKKYIHHFTGSIPANYISKELLLHEISFFEKVVMVLVYLLLIVPFFGLTLFSKNKASLSLIFREIAENSALLNSATKNKLTQCYFFSIYEKDANIAAVLLMKAGVKVIKIPSEVPFYFFNTIMVCNKLIICNAYQYDELKYYGDTIICEETEMYGPERVTDYYEIYNNGDFQIQRNTIAFYSTASWVREKEGHLDQGTAMAKNEKLLLGYLREYLSEKKDLKLVIYAHPKEKSEKYINETKNYYGKLLKGIAFEFADFKLLSSATFYKAELAVAFNSTLIHERLYFGFKTLILPLDHKGFPVANSNFNNICAYNKEELFTKMDRALAQSEVEFFRANGIENYKFK